jgi:hypothetical protein
MRHRLRTPIFGALTTLLALACSDDSNSQGEGGGGSDTAGSGAGTTTGAGPTTGTAGTASTSSSTGTGGGGTVPVDPPTCVDPTTLPAWRQGMAIGEWKHLDSIDLDAVRPDVQPGGYYAARIDAWNGFAADTTTSRLFLAAAGGHADYAGNEVYSLDLNAAAPQWVIESQPSPASAYTIDQPYYTDGRPSATHNYYSTWYIEQRAKVFRFPNGATWGTGNGSTPHIDAWDPVTKDWDAAGTHPDLGPSPIYEAPTAKNILTGDVYQVQANNHLYAWYAQTDTMEDLGDAQGGTGSFYDLYKSPSVIDPVANRLILFSDGNNPGTVRVYDFTSKAWSNVAVAGSAASAVTATESQAMVHYDVCAESFVMKTNDGGSVYFIARDTLEASQLGTSGNAPPDTINGVHTLFQYLPKLGGYAYQPRYDAGLYFLATQ